MPIKDEEEERSPAKGGRKESWKACKGVDGSDVSGECTRRMDGETV